MSTKGLRVVEKVHIRVPNKSEFSYKSLHKKSKMKSVFVLFALTLFAGLVSADLLELAGQIYSAAKDSDVVSAVVDLVAPNGISTEDGYKEAHKEFVNHYFTPCSRYLQQNNLINDWEDVEEQFKDPMPTDGDEVKTTVCKALFINYSDIVTRLHEFITLN